jgi:IcmF-related N-terminal domain
MSAWENEARRIPMPAKVGAAAAAGGGFLALVYAYRNEAAFLAILLIGIVFVVLLLAMYKMFLQWRDQRKGGEFGSKIKDKAASQPAGATSAKNKALLDDLRKKFQDGLAVFEKSGKSVYKLPWYLVVGESGSGKSRMIEKTELSAPPRLKDPVEGAGGTINMNWWFRNDAVFLDTAGRLMMPEVSTGENHEWNEFLKLLSRARPNAPINGLLLVIPADTLETDSTDQITAKSKQIAEQFAHVQEMLDVRFPVYVVITKCDRINGFKQFFEGMTQPEEQAQMLGWSNPDQSFRPESVDEHLEYVRQRLLRRRLGLLEDPINKESPDLRRLDQVDSLYIFPDKLRTLGQRLRRYLEAIFTSGEWSSNKPPLLRGIYFTSALQKGGVVDKVLSDVLGLDVARALGEDKETQTPYFLRDLFVEKAFREKGLVTRATDVNRMKRRRKIVLIGTGFAAVATLGAFTWHGQHKLDETVGRQERFWRYVSDSVQGGGAKTLQIVDPVTQAYRGGEKISESDNWTLRGIHADAPERLATSMDPPAIYRPVAAIHPKLSAERAAAYSALYKETVMRPLIEQARAKIRRMTDDQWDDDATDALRQLIWLESGQDLPEPARLDGAPVRQLFKFVVKADATTPDARAATDESAAYERAFDLVYPGGKVDRQGPCAIDTNASRASVERGITLYLGSAEKQTQSARELATAVDRVKDALEKFDAAESEVTKLTKQDDDTRPTATAFLDEYERRMASLAQSKGALDTALADTLIQKRGDQKLADYYRKGVEEAQAGRLKKIENLIAQIPESARGKGALRDAYRRLDEARTQAAAATADAAKNPTFTVVARQEPLLLDKAIGVRSEVQPRYQIHFWVLSQARSRIPGPDATLALADAVRQVRDGHRSLLSQIAAVRDSKPLSQENQFQEVCAMAQFTGRLAAKRNLYDLITPQLRDVLGTSAGWQGEIKARVPRDAAAAPPKIPLTNFDGTLDPAFDPVSAAEAIQTMDIITREMQPDAVAAVGAAGPLDGVRPLDIDNVRQKWQAVQSGWGDYRRDYENYWQKTLADRLAVQTNLKWPEFRGKLREIDAAKVNALWHDVENRQAKALAAIASPQARGASTGGAAPGAGAAANAGPADDTCKAVLSAWTKLPDQAVDARDRLLILAWETLARTYLMELPPPAPPGAANPVPPPTFADTYWANVFYEALGAIHKDVQENADKALKDVKALRHFPLAAPDTAEKPLSRDRVRDAARLARAVRAVSTDPKSVGGGAQAPKGMARVKDRIDAIRQGVPNLADEDARWLESVQALVRAMDENLTVSVFLGEAIPQDFKNQFFYASMELRKGAADQPWPNVRNPQKDMPLSPPNSPAFPEDGVKLHTQRDANDAKTRAVVWSDPGPFAVIMMLHRLKDPTRTPAQAGKGVAWSGNMEFEVEQLDKTRQKMTLPITLRFSDNVDWPSAPPAGR